MSENVLFCFKREQLELRTQKTRWIIQVIFLLKIMAVVNLRSRLYVCVSGESFMAFVMLVIRRTVSANARLCDNRGINTSLHSLISDGFITVSKISIYL